MSQKQQRRHDILFSISPSTVRNNNVVTIFSSRSLRQRCEATTSSRYSLLDLSVNGAKQQRRHDILFSISPSTVRNNNVVTIFSSRSLRQQCETTTPWSEDFLRSRWHRLRTSGTWCRVEGHARHGDPCHDSVQRPEDKAYCIKSILRYLPCPWKLHNG